MDGEIQGWEGGKVQAVQYGVHEIFLPDIIIFMLKDQNRLVGMFFMTNDRAFAGEDKFSLAHQYYVG